MLAHRGDKSYNYSLHNITSGNIGNSFLVGLTIRHSYLLQSDCHQDKLNNIYNWKAYYTINPLSANTDQQQLSPNNIHTLWRDEVMRINVKITKEKMPWSFIKFRLLILIRNVWRSVWTICTWILGLKLNWVLTSSRLVLNSSMYLWVAFCFSSLFSSSLRNKIRQKISEHNYP